MFGDNVEHRPGIPNIAPGNNEEATADIAYQTTGIGVPLAAVTTSEFIANP